MAYVENRGPDRFLHGPPKGFIRPGVRKHWWSAPLCTHRDWNRGHL